MRYGQEGADASEQPVELARAILAEDQQIERGIGVDVRRPVSFLGGDRKERWVDFSH